MNLIDTLDVYSALHDSDDLTLMLNDYTIDARVSRDTLNTVIISELGATRPITTDPDMFKILLESFFNKYALNITRLVDTMYLEYNPLDTRNIVETEHRYSEGDIDNTDNYTNTTGQEDKVSAYDSSGYQPKSKTDGSIAHEGETTSDIKSTVDTERNIRGNEGKETFQSLIEQERKLAEFNIFNWIIKQMRKELFLKVY